MECLSAARERVASLCAPLQGPCARYVLYPLKFTASLVFFLVIVIYLLLALLANSLGMLGMSLVMPSFMRLVYPSRLGQVHTMALGIYRRWFVSDEGHSRSIRIDLLASDGATDGAVPSAAAAATELWSPAAAAAPMRDEEVAVVEARSSSRSALRPYSVHTVACLADNYAYIIVDRSGEDAEAMARIKRKK